MIPKKLTNTHVMLCRPIENFLGWLKVYHCLHFKAFFEAYWARYYHVTLSNITKFQKSLVPNVWCNKNRFTCRTTTPFDSADAHGLREVFETKFWIPKHFEFFLRAPQLTSSRLRRDNFLWFRCDFYENSSKS